MPAMVLMIVTVIAFIIGIVFILVRRPRIIIRMAFSQASHVFPIIAPSLSPWPSSSSLPLRLRGGDRHHRGHMFGKDTSESEYRIVGLGGIVAEISFT